MPGGDQALRYGETAPSSWAIQRVFPWAKRRQLADWESEVTLPRTGRSRWIGKYRRSARFASDTSVDIPVQAGTYWAELEDKLQRMADNDVLHHRLLSVKWSRKYPMTIYFTVMQYSLYPNEANHQLLYGYYPVGADRTATGSSPFTMSNSPRE